MESAVTTESRTQRRSIFARVLVGVDGSSQSVEAARQAAMLAEGWVGLLAVYDIAPRVVGGAGIGVPSYYDEGFQRANAGAALAEVKAAVKGLSTAQTELTGGNARDALLASARGHETTLIAIGAHGARRIEGILLGSVATGLLHKSACPVLVTRPAGPAFPRRIVVGVDGSPESAAAYAVATRLVDRFGSELWPVVAHGGKPVDGDAVAAIVGSRREDLPDEPVDALVAAAADADLLVVGSRGLHGIRSLGSVSERVAHRAACSTLVVR